MVPHSDDQFLKLLCLFCNWYWRYGICSIEMMNYKWNCDNPKWILIIDFGLPMFCPNKCYCLSCREFVNCVRCIRILSPQEVQQMSLDGDLGNNILPNQACSSSDGGNAWRARCDQNSGNPSNGSYDQFEWPNLPVHTCCAVLVQVGVTWLNGGRRKACIGRMLCRCVASLHPWEQMARWISSVFVHMCRFSHMEEK